MTPSVFAAALLLCGRPHSHTQRLFTPQTGGRVGPGARGAAHAARGAVRAARAGQGAGLRAVLRLLQEEPLAAAPRPRTRPRRRAPRPPPAARPALHQLAATQQPHRQTEERRAQGGLPRQQPAHHLQGRGEGGGQRRQEAEDGPAPRRQRLLALRTVGLKVAR